MLPRRIDTLYESYLAASCRMTAAHHALGTAAIRQRCLLHRRDAVTRQSSERPPRSGSSIGGCRRDLSWCFRPELALQLANCSLQQGLEPPNLGAWCMSPENVRCSGWGFLAASLSISAMARCCGRPVGSSGCRALRAWLFIHGYEAAAFLVLSKVGRWCYVALPDNASEPHRDNQSCLRVTACGH